METVGFVLFVLCTALAWQAIDVRCARACGCFSPPAPPPVPPPNPTSVDFAVNQQAELLIFEVEPGDDPHVTAHVLIRYAGDPEKFAWLIPVPAVPELALSQTEAFGLIDDQTRPITEVVQRNLCPQQQWACRMHPPPTCVFNGGRSDFGFGAQGASNGGGDSGDFGSLAAGTGGAGSAPPPAVVVHARQSVGDYETVTIGAGDGQAAVQWLNDEGFIVNASMGKFMQPYLDAGMLFLASKLQPSADVGELRPLRMRYAGSTPSIPLRLTAVAAEPHLAVTAFIYADGPYEPYGRPLVEVGEGDLGSPDGTRSNYPAVLSRLADSVGGDGFVLEYYGTPPGYTDPNPTCCSVNPNNPTTELDSCGVAGNGRCECPLRDFDAADCGGDTGPAAAIGLVAELASKYARVTRLTTRLSPEEMTFDPVFRPMVGDEPQLGRRRFEAARTNLDGCEAQVIDRAQFDAVAAIEPCAGTYCGVDGTCAGTAEGAGCVCSRTELARTFIDLDGVQSVTCVPQLGTVDFTAGGIELPSACDNQELTEGASCFDIGGFPTVLCPAGQAAVSTGAPVPACHPVVAVAPDTGARDYTAVLESVDVCAPAPPACTNHGWLEEVAVERRGSQCASSTPDPSWLEVPPMPTCDNYSPEVVTTVAARRDDNASILCGCRAVGSGGRGAAGSGALALLGLALGAARLRRRRM